MEDEILTRVQALVDLIKQSSTYQEYQKIKQKMAHNPDLMHLIASYKDCQKKFVQCTYRRNKEEAARLEEELQNLERTLNQVPIYAEYVALLEPLNQSLGTIKDQLENYFAEKTKDL